MEGQRLFDLRRWGNPYAANAINGYINNEGGGNEKTRVTYKASAEVFADRHLLFPLPNIQIQLSKVGAEDRLKQNTGW